MADDDDDIERKLFVGGIKEMEEKDLEPYFQKFGPLKSVDIKVTVSGKSRGFGFVTFESPDSVKACLDINSHIINDATVAVKKCEQRPKEDLEPLEDGEIVQQPLPASLGTFLKSITADDLKVPDLPPEVKEAEKREAERFEAEMKKNRKSTPMNKKEPPKKQPEPMPEKKKESEKKKTPKPKPVLTDDNGNKVGLTSKIEEKLKMKGLSFSEALNDPKISEAVKKLESSIPALIGLQQKKVPIESPVVEKKETEEINSVSAAIEKFASQTDISPKENFPPRGKPISRESLPPKKRRTLLPSPIVPPNSYAIRVSGVADLPQETVISFFLRYGNIVDASLRRNSRTGIIWFAEEQSKDKALCQGTVNIDQHECHVHDHVGNEDRSRSSPSGNNSSMHRLEKTKKNSHDSRKRDHHKMSGHHGRRQGHEHQSRQPPKVKRLVDVVMGPTVLGPTVLGPTVIGPTVIGPTVTGPTGFGDVANREFDDEFDDMGREFDDKFDGMENREFDDEFDGMGREFDDDRQKVKENKQDVDYRQKMPPRMQQQPQQLAFGHPSVRKPASIQQQQTPFGAPVSGGALSGARIWNPAVPPPLTLSQASGGKPSLLGQGFPLRAQTPMQQQGPPMIHQPMQQQRPMLHRPPVQMAPPGLQQQQQMMRPGAPFAIPGGDNPPEWAKTLMTMLDRAPVPLFNPAVPPPNFGVAPPPGLRPMAAAGDAVPPIHLTAPDDEDHKKDEVKSPARPAEEKKVQEAPAPEVNMEFVEDTMNLLSAMIKMMVILMGKLSLPNSQLLDLMKSNLADKMIEIAEWKKVQDKKKREKEERKKTKHGIMPQQQFLPQQGQFYNGLPATKQREIVTNHQFPPKISVQQQQGLQQQFQPQQLMSLGELMQQQRPQQKMMEQPKPLMNQESVSIFGQQQFLPMQAGQVQDTRFMSELKSQDAIGQEEESAGQFSQQFQQPLPLLGEAPMQKGAEHMKQTPPVTPLMSMELAAPSGATANATLKAPKDGQNWWE